MSRNQPPDEVDTNRNGHRDSGRERQQPYATETEEYSKEAAKPPKDGSVRSKEGKRPRPSGR